MKNYFSEGRMPPITFWTGKPLCPRDDLLARGHSALVIQMSVSLEAVNVLIP